MIELTSATTRKYRFIWKLDGINGTRARLAPATIDVTAKNIICNTAQERTTTSWIQFLDNLSNTKVSLDWIDTFWFNETTGKYETNFQGLELSPDPLLGYVQAKVWFGNFTLSEGATAYLDPTTTAFDSEPSLDGYIYKYAEEEYPPTQETHVVTGNQCVIVGQHGIPDRPPYAYYKYRGYVSFNTISIPSFACNMSATLKLKTFHLPEPDPNFTLKVIGGHQPIYEDSLDTSDWNAGSSTITTWNTSNYPGDNIYINLTISGDQMNKFGRTQFRLVSNRDEENIQPQSREYIMFYSGDSSSENKPELEVTYYIDAAIEEINGTNWYYKNATNEKVVMFLDGGEAYGNYVKVFSLDNPNAGTQEKMEFVDGLLENGFAVLTNKDDKIRYDGDEAWVVDAALWLIEEGYLYVFLFGLSAGGVVVASEIQQGYAKVFSAAVVASAPVDWTNQTGIFQSAHTASQANVNTSFIAPEYDPPYIVPRTYEQMSRYYGNMTVGKEWNNWNGGHNVFPNTSKDTGEDLLTVVLNWYNEPHPQSVLFTPPNTPSTPSGSQVGCKDVSYSYTTSTTDPDGDDIQYRFSWGDGTHTTTNWNSSGANATASHTWSRPGTYNISVRAQDATELWSDWSSPLTVTIDQNDAGSGGDAGNNFPAAIYINEEIYYHGNLYKSNPTDTEDWYKFYVADGQNIYLTMTPQSNVDFHLHLYDPHGIWLHPLEEGHDGGDGETDWFSQDADMNGNWSVRIYGSESGEYTFYLSIQSGGGGGGRCPTLFVWNGTGYVDYGVIDIHDASGEDVVEEVSVETEDVGLHNYKAYFRLREGWPGLNFSESVIDQVKLYAVDNSGNRHLCPLISATHSRLGNVWLELLFSDDRRSQILLLETIDLKFIVPYEDVQSFTFIIEGCNQFKQ